MINLILEIQLPIGYINQYYASLASKKQANQKYWAHTTFRYVLGGVNMIRVKDK